MTSTKRLYEGMHLVAVANPATATNASPLRTGAVDMTKYRRVIAVAALGDMSAQAIDFKLESSKVPTFNDSPSSTADVVKATQLSGHASNNDNKQIVLECSGGDLTGGTRYLRGSLTIAAASPDTGGPACIMIFGEPFYSNETRLSSVVETKVA